MSEPTIQTRASLAERLWHAPSAKAFMLLMAAASFVTPAHAQSGGSSFDGFGAKLGSVLCNLINSPIVTILVGAGMVGLLITAVVNEDNRLLSSALKIVVCGLAIIFVPGLLTMMGFKPLSGC